MFGRFNTSLLLNNDVYMCTLTPVLTAWGEILGHLGMKSNLRSLIKRSCPAVELLDPVPAPNKAGQVSQELMTTGRLGKLATSLKERKKLMELLGELPDDKKRPHPMLMLK
ncbi:UNVERIFIED_CONTAM: hypothetical protein K2H54_039522 [Gekko kuhli]